MTSMISDETLQKIQDKLEELSHKIKALELLKLSMSSLENQSPVFAKNVGVGGTLNVDGLTSLNGGVAITGSATIGPDNILTTSSVLNLGAYGTANAAGQTRLQNQAVLFSGTITVAGGVGFDTVTGAIVLPPGGSYLISIDLDADTTNTSDSVVLTDNSAINLDIITATKSSGAANFIVGASVSYVSLFITNKSANSFICDGGSVSVVRVDAA